MAVGKDLLTRTQRMYKTKTNDKLVFINVSRIFSSKEATKMEKQARDRERIFTTHS